jgi:molybdopterin converting factor small subunit
MSEKARKRHEENENKGSKTVADQQIRQPVDDFTEPKAQVKAEGLRDREDSGIVVNDYPNESIVKENNTLTKNDEVKLRITSDKEC